MFQQQERKINHLADARLFSVIMWSSIKILIATALVYYFSFGIYLVIGYLIFAIESAIHDKHLNNQQIDLQLNIIHQKLDELSEK